MRTLYEVEQLEPQSRAFLRIARPIQEPPRQKPKLERTTMLYVDIPTRDEFVSLVGARADACVSIYLKTTPVTQEIEGARIEMGNLLREAQRQLEEADFDKRRLKMLVEQVEDLIDDREFWRFQANSLAVFVTPDNLRTYRLANELTSMVQVADRFHLKPLFRATTFPHSAYVLALSEKAARLVEMHADLPAQAVEVQDMPRDGAPPVGDTGPDAQLDKQRQRGAERENVRLQQYVRQVDRALRTILAGRETPLILATTDRLASLFRQISSYPHLLPETIAGSPDRLSDRELAERARPLLDKSYQREIAELRELFAQRVGEGRTLTDVSDAARAATFGAIQTLMVDIDSVVPGYVDDETGAVSFAAEDDAKAYGVVDEIVGRAFASGAQVLAVRREDIPGGGDLAAILRYSR